MVGAVVTNDDRENELTLNNVEAQVLFSQSEYVGACPNYLMAKGNQSSL